MAKIRVGVLGLSHDHIWHNLSDLARSENAILVAAADPRPELRSKVRSYGCDRDFEDAHQLLDSVSLDAVFIYSNNRESAELAIEAAQRGLHVLVEKPMAADYAGAAAMAAAAYAAKTHLMVNWPFIWWPSLQFALNLAAQGRIGDIFQVTYRAAHAGPREAGCSPAFSEWLLDPHRNGSGALMDYCSYGAALTCLLLGLPSRVMAATSRVNKLDLLAEDNAVVIMQHASAISTSVASWTQIGHMTSYIPAFYGSSGTIVVTSDSVQLATLESQAEHRLEIPAVTGHNVSSVAFFLHHIDSNQPITGICGPLVSLDAQQVLEAALASAGTERTVTLPLPTGRLARNPAQ